jgi:hypothetical protein
MRCDRIGAHLLFLTGALLVGCGAGSGGTLGPGSDDLNPGKADDLNPGSGPAWREKLSTLEEYRSLVISLQGYSFVKFSYEIADPAQTIFFQNTSLHPFHHPFLSTKIEKYKNISPETLYNDLMVRPCREGLALGAVYYSGQLTVPDDPEPGVLGFTVFMSSFDQCRIAATHARLKELAPFAKGRVGFIFERNEDYFKHAKKLEQAGVPVFRAKQFFGSGDQNVTYNQALSYGYLKQLNDQSVQDGDYSSKDILVLKNVPRDIGPIAGLITAEMQVPHSHVVLRCINQKIPDLYVVNASSNGQILRSLGRLVQLEALANGEFTIKNSDDLGETQLAALAEEYFKNRVPELPDPVYDLAPRDLFAWPGQVLSPGQYSVYGSKGVNFGLLDQTLAKAGFDRSLFQGGFLIPFARYADHVQQKLSKTLCQAAQKKCASSWGSSCQAPSASCSSLAAAGSRIADFLAKTIEATTTQKIVADSAFRKGWLEFTRRLIEKAPLDPALLGTLQTKILAAYPATTRIRFRSSTNSEDLPGLNGAGFYTSKAGCIADGDGQSSGPSACQTALELARTQELIDELKQKDPVAYADLIADLIADLTEKKPLDKAVKKVFASLWTDKAFLFRDYFRIKHAKVFMGILVHPSFVDEGANGVAFFGPGATSGSLDLDAVVQQGEISITNPEIYDAIPDQFNLTIDPSGALGAPSYVSHSNLIPSGTSVLGPEQITSLAQQIKIVYGALKAFIGASDAFRLDSEFKLDGNGVILIKQARPIP